MILYIENPKDATRKLPGIIDEFAKAARYKSNIQKSVTFLYTKNKVSEKEIKETIPFTIRNQRSNCQHPLDRQKSKSSRKISISALLTMPKPLIVWTTTSSGKFLER